MARFGEQQARSRSSISGDHESDWAMTADWFIKQPAFDGIGRYSLDLDNVNPLPPPFAFLPFPSHADFFAALVLLALPLPPYSFALLWPSRLYIFDSI